MTKRKSTSDAPSRRGRPRVARLAHNIPNVKKNQNDDIIKQQEFEKQIMASPLEEKVGSNQKMQEFINEINQLKNQNESLLKKVSQLEETNATLKVEIENQNQSFLEKVQQKAKEAQKLVDERVAFYEKQKNDEVIKIKNSVFEEVASSFLEPIILLESIINSSPTDPIIVNYLQGFKMLLNQFDEKLGELGIREINVNVGDPFNELYMEAFDVVENPNFPSHAVVKIVKKGFSTSDQKVLKHTLVIVNK